MPAAYSKRAARKAAVQRIDLALLQLYHALLTFFGLPAESFLLEDEDVTAARIGRLRRELELSRKPSVRM